MYMYMHTSVLFHHINDAIVNCTRRNNLQSCGNILLHFILERVCKGGRGGGGGIHHSDRYQMTDAWLHWRLHCHIIPCKIKGCVSVLAFFYVTPDRVRCVTRRSDG